MERLSSTVQTAYAELLDQLVAFEARRSIGYAPGAFVTKNVKGHAYCYFQYSSPGSAVRQVYLGRKSDALDGMIARFATERDAANMDREEIVRIAAVARAGGAGLTDAASARVLAALAEAGVFRLGGVLVGTQAFLVLGNVLGVRWTGAHARTEDVDIAGAKNLEVAVPDVRADVPAALESLAMGFVPVPGLSPKSASTSFKVRGRGLRVDLVTPAGGRRTTGAVLIPRFNAAATPLQFLDFVLEDAQPAALIDRGAVLVTVPSPARFALHKLLVAGARPSALQTKVEKELIQAALVIDLLEEDRPGDLRLAWEAARGRGWSRPMRAASTLLRRRWPATHARLEAILAGVDRR
jgi:hypothetical protein